MHRTKEEEGEGEHIMARGGSLSLSLCVFSRVSQKSPSRLSLYVFRGEKNRIFMTRFLRNLQLLTLNSLSPVARSVSQLLRSAKRIRRRKREQSVKRTTTTKKRERLLHIIRMDANNEFASGAFYAFLASIFFGSFAVPIKTKSIVRAKVDPVAVRALNTSSLYAHD